MDKTNFLLRAHKFYSISEKNRIKATKQSKEELEEILSSYDIEYTEIVNRIIDGFRFATEYNIKQVNSMLKSFDDNMKSDLGFMLKLISLDYRFLKTTSFSNKKQMLNEIEALITKYSEFSDDQNRIEMYD